MQRHVTPRFEPEVVIVAARKSPRGDDEKVPTTSLKGTNINGVYLSSRYGKAHELDAMANLVDGVGPELHCFIDTIWCDSQALCCYSVTLNPCTRAQAKEIANQIHEACIKHNGGYNGIDIQGAAGGNLYFDPSWPLAGNALS